MIENRRYHDLSSEKWGPLRENHLEMAGFSAKNTTSDPIPFFCAALESYFQHLSTYQLNIIDNRNLRDEFRYSPMGFSVEAHRCPPLGCVGSSWFPSKTNLYIANLIINMKMGQNMSNHTSNVAM
jgi:hypothetical protein